MSAHKSRSGAYGAYTGSGRKKTSVSYTLREAKEPLNRSGINRIRIDQANRLLFTAGRDSIVRSWDINRDDIETSVACLEHHTDWVNDIILCNDHKTLMSASSDTSLKVWDTSRGVCTSTLRTHKDYVQALAYSPITQTVVSAGLDHNLYLWDLTALVSLTAAKNTVTTIPLKGQKESVYSLDISESGTTVISGSTEKALRLWDTRTNQKIMKLKGHTDNVRAVVLNRDATECLSGSSDGTVKLWSIVQQRCVETFRMHDEGVWALAVDENFKCFYSSGRDCKVFYTDISEGGSGGDGTLLFKEEYPVLSMCLDDRALWVSTTSSCIRKWPSQPHDMFGEGDMDINGDDEEPRVTDIDEVSFHFDRPLATIPGRSAIVDVKILNNRRQVLTKDSQGGVTLWDVLHARKEADLGQVDLDDEVEKRKELLYVPNWFSCDIKTGMLAIRLEENECFSAWVMGDNTNLETATSDLKLNYGALILRALFDHWPQSYTFKEKQRQAKKEAKVNKNDPLNMDRFMAVASEVKDIHELGLALGVPHDTMLALESDSKAVTLEKLFKILETESDEVLTISLLSTALENIKYDKLAADLRALTVEDPDSDGEQNKVVLQFFTVPPHIPVVLSESTDCGSTLARFLCTDAGQSHESRLLDTYCPLWITDIVVQNQLPNHPKMSFTLSKFQDMEKTNDSKADRLSAQDILTMKKVLDYLYNKLYGEKGKLDKNDQKMESSDVLELYCQNQLLDPLMDVRTVRLTVWRSGGDMKLYYKQKELPLDQEA